MNMADLYFAQALSEETTADDLPALLHYLAAFCDSMNSGTPETSYRSVNKIRKLQLRIGISDRVLLDLVHSYGPLNDNECQNALAASINGDLETIHTILAKGKQNEIT